MANDNTTIESSIHFDQMASDVLFEWAVLQSLDTLQLDRTPQLRYLRGACKL